MYTDSADLDLGNSPVDEPKSKQVWTGLLVRLEQLTRNEQVSGSSPLVALYSCPYCRKNIKCRRYIEVCSEFFYSNVTVTG